MPFSGGGIGGGWLRRTAPLVGVAARTAGEAVVAGLRSKLRGTDSAEFHARPAERYVEVLGRSKGALMKAGQMLSFVSLGPVVGSDFQLSYQAALARLSSGAPPMAPGLVREVLEGELGCAAEKVFASFDWVALAAASIGQVHGARLLDGRAVAVKIQYPGVAAAIAAVLKNTELLSTFLGLLGGLSGRRLSLDLRGAAREIGERVVEELDYRREAASQAEFAALYRGHPFIRVPEVLGELCSGRVLIQELVEGKPWGEALRCEQGLRDGWAEAIYRFLYGSYHYYHVLNADPHPGNFVFHEDGSVSCLDFGCIKRFERGQVEALDLVLRECLRGDVQETWRVSVEGGFFEPSGSITPGEVFGYWREPIEMYWAQQPFTVTPEYVARLIERRYSPAGPSANAFAHLATPAAYTIMSRIDIGVMSLFAALHATNNWKSIAGEYFEDAHPATAMGKLDRAYRSERLEVGSRG
jgi:predicted unusual protein kinase regulating ubiquinone biosynthesis (AarF/ABC1/UbiB family)